MLALRSIIWYLKLTLCGPEKMNGLIGIVIGCVSGYAQYELTEKLDTDGYEDFHQKIYNGMNFETREL
jgi:hypothetical protein